ncbi:hypothetical protein FPOAC1_000867 [Fusarium poae]|uniref:hypothetical protein n=1 Tax=Fusarium poae TaxID=36050 RepID=UPI001CE7EC18|nr:hypothetical protein FPOAC1_000867 [Fusarium poae]KAG8674893.1 hypothetical protein FPOAC1_000867 [Fusarium poae]
MLSGATEQSGALCYACRALTWGDFILQRDETSGVWRPKNILSVFHEAWTLGLSFTNQIPMPLGIRRENLTLLRKRAGIENVKEQKKEFELNKQPDVVD